MPTHRDHLAILTCPMEQPNDANAATVGQYLSRLLTTLWVEEDGFSGKRPLGNSGWCWDIYNALADRGVIIAERDDDGMWDLRKSSINEVDRRICAAIEWLFGNPMPFGDE